MATLTIGGEIIQFPETAQSPAWSEAIIQFASAVEGVLASVSGAFDVPPLVLPVTNDINTNIEIPRLSFPASDVRSAFIRYALYRASSSTVEAETGTLEIIYNNVAATWEISREATGTDNGWSFNVTTTGIVRFSTTAIAGTFSSAALSYQASAILQTE